MVFVDFLRTAVLVCAAAATALATIAVAAANSAGNPNAVLIVAGWWGISTIIGLRLGRRAEASPPIARLLSESRAQAALPELRPARVLLNRLWPLLLFTLGAAVLGLVLVQIPGIAAGFAIIGALTWRRQPGAVLAIEHRDGVRFFVARTSPVKPISLIRAPGFKAYLPHAA
ncbi:MAG: hypothetical protein ACR2ND_05775 [Solirubrobacteraceae bacterium]